MKTKIADVKLSPIEIKRGEGNKITATVSEVHKYSSAVYELVPPCIVFAVVDDDNEVEVEVRPITYGVEEDFYFPVAAKYAYIGCDYGLLGGRSFPISTGYNKTVYSYLNAVFPGDRRFCVYSRSGKIPGENYVVSINHKNVGRKALIIGDDWEIGDNFTIGGYFSNGVESQ